jgi:hypothetical protein
MTSMHDHYRQITLTIDAGPQVDAAELASLTQRLRAELLQLDIEDVTLARTEETAPGARSGDVIQWGTLLVTFGDSPELVLSALIAGVQMWLIRQDRADLSAIIKSGATHAQIAAASAENVEALAKMLVQHIDDHKR